MFLYYFLHITMAIHCCIMSISQHITTYHTISCCDMLVMSRRISLLLHQTEGKARGQVLITMISYECLWYNWLISYSLWLQTAGKETSNIDDLLDGIDIKHQDWKNFWTNYCYLYIMKIQTALLMFLRVITAL